MTQIPHLLLAFLILTAAPLGAAQQEQKAAPEFDSQGVGWGPWWVLGPFDHEVGATSVVPDHKPEKEFRKMKAGKPWKGLEQDYRGKGKAEIVWTRFGPEKRHEPDIGMINLVATVPPVAGVDKWNENAVAYLYREVHALRPVEVDIMFGSDDGVRAWVNGELKLSRNAARGVSVRDERLKLRLEEGVNHLVFKINNGGGAWGFQMARYAHIKQERINTAIDKGVDWLLKRQLIDGSWGEEHGRYRNGMTALAVYTLLKSGVPARHPAILEALAFMAESPTTMTYSAGCHLMALEALRDEEYLPWMEEILGDLLSWQNRQGVWGYPTGHPDLSCTQFAALGLRAAAQAGLEIPDRVWVDLADGTLAYQLKRERVDTPNALEEAYGNKLSVAGFSYRDVHPMSARGSMTTAGIATLAICLEQLGDRCPGNLRSQMERQIEYGMNWMIVHWSVSSNPGLNHWHHYYLYGLERVGAMLDTEQVGPREWYWDGAEFLCNQQVSQGINLGAWPDPYGRTESATCFALLFLRRATQAAFTDPHGSAAKKVAKSDVKAAPVQVAAMAASPASFWVNRVDLDALGNRQIVGVDYFGRSPGGDWKLLASREAPAEPNPRERFAGRYTFIAAGTYEIHAVAYLDDDSEIKTGVASITVEEATEAGIRSYPQDAAKNLMPSGQPEVQVSSGGGPRNLIDNKMVTGWTCAGNDATPTIEFDLQRPVTADKLLFTHARTRPIQQNNNPRVTKVRVWIDREDPIDVAIDPDYRTKSVMRLPEATSIRKLKIQILEATGGEVGKAALGFSEIELQGPRKRRGRR
ncbi:MAG: hypothetical protein CMJ94_10730 [Planctomycetes bacterium]|nr:hypothetical protein [Planctomycetota bacterium]